MIQGDFEMCSFIEKNKLIFKQNIILHFWRNKNYRTNFQAKYYGTRGKIMKIHFSWITLSKCFECKNMQENTGN